MPDLCHHVPDLCHHMIFLGLACTPLTWVIGCPGGEDEEAPLPLRLALLGQAEELLHRHGRGGGTCRDKHRGGGGTWTCVVCWGN